MGNTLFMFAQASTGEDESPKNGLDGDQTGIELNCRAWFQSSPPWAKVYRFTDTETADAIATVMERLVANGWVGYDTSDRESMQTELAEVSFDPNELVTPCTTDCSALVYAAVYAVTGVAYNYIEEYPLEMGQPEEGVPKVRNFDHYMEVQMPAAGYAIEVYTIPTPSGTSGRYDSSHDVSGTNLTVSVTADNEDLYLNDNGALLRGDIVRTVAPHESGHIAMWV